MGIDTNPTDLARVRRSIQQLDAAVRANILNVDKVGGKDVDDTATDDGSLWTAQKIIDHTDEARCASWMGL